MKKLIVIALVLFAGRSFSQVSKADFESLFAKFKYENMSSIWMKNVKTYYTNGSSSLEQNEYKASNFSFELKENCIYFFLLRGCS
jgi:hypothetical protein